MNEEEMNKPSETNWEEVDALTDETIDISDIPPLSALYFERAAVRMSLNSNSDKVMNKRKLLEQILSSSKNVSFSDMIALVEAFGFRLARTSGSHHIFKYPGVHENVNLQNVGGKAKPYQVRQFLQLIEQYNLTLGDEE